MLQRLLFVAGMTVGVMVPLIWAAYVSMPEFQASHERTGNWRQRDAIGTDLRETPKPQDATAAADGSQQKSDTKSVTTSVSPSLEPEPEPSTKPILPQGNDRKADQAPPSSKTGKPGPAEVESVTPSASPSLEPEPEQLTKPILPQGHDRKADQALPSSEKVKPRSGEDVISTGSIAPKAKKKLHGKHSAGERNAGHNKKKRASSKRAARHKHKIVDEAPRRDHSGRADFYVGDSCRQLEKISDNRDGWMRGHRLGCW